LFLTASSAKFAKPLIDVSGFLISWLTSERNSSPTRTPLLSSDFMIASVQHSQDRFAACSSPEKDRKPGGEFEEIFRRL